MVILQFCHCASLTAHNKMAAVKKSLCRNMTKMTSIEGQRLAPKCQIVGNVPYVSGMRVAELNFLLFKLHLYHIVS